MPISTACSGASAAGGDVRSFDHGRRDRGLRLARQQIRGGRSRKETQHVGIPSIRNHVIPALSPSDERIRRYGPAHAGSKIVSGLVAVCARSARRHYPSRKLGRTTRPRQVPRC